MRAAIDNLHGSIHANDNKSSSALVVHGLLAASVVALTTQLGSIHNEATSAMRFGLILDLGVALICFAASVLFLLWTLYPHEPRSLDRRIRGEYKHLFFPALEWLRPGSTTQDNEVRRLRPALAAMVDDDALDDEYLAELVKVAEIRDVDATRTRRGIVLLGFEVILVLLYLVLLGVVSQGWLSTRRDATPPPTIAWQLTTATGTHALRGADPDLALAPPNRNAFVSITASSNGHLRSLEVWKRETYVCAGSASAVLVTATGDDPAAEVDVGSQDQSTKTRTIHQTLPAGNLRCPSVDAPTEAVFVLTAEATDSSGAVSRQTIKFRDSRPAARPIVHHVTHRRCRRWRWAGQTRAGPSVEP